MKRYRYYRPPRTRLPILSGILAGLVGCDMIYTMTTVTYYENYWDYWALLGASLLLCVFCIAFRRRHAWLTLLPAALVALIACAAPNVIHWMEIIVFFLLLLLWLLRLPKWCGTLFRTTGIVCGIIGFFVTLLPVLERVHRLSQTGNATAEFVLPLVLRSFGSDFLCLLALLSMLFAMRPFLPPAWTDENDRFDRIWE